MWVDRDDHRFIFRQIGNSFLNPSLILASRSPRRKTILSFWGVAFRVEPSRGISESALRAETPKNLVRRLAMQKAEEVSSRFPEKLVIGADTLVLAQGIILGKPANSLEAYRMIKCLSGQSHHVFTGMALAWPDGRKRESYVETSRVSFRPLSEREIRAYVQTPEPYDKAGAYDIRGQGGRWLDKLKGDYFNVMGLPVHWLLPRLMRFGLIRSGRF